MCISNYLYFNYYNTGAYLLIPLITPFICSLHQCLDHSHFSIVSSAILLHLAYFLYLFLFQNIWFGVGFIMYRVVLSSLMY